MPVRRSLGHGELVRPLLDLPRAELVAYARRQRLSWVEDPTNMDESLDRNYLRRRVLPGLRQRWPRADQALVHSMVERTLVERLLVHSSRLDARSPTLPLATLRDRPLADQVTLLRLWLQGRREVLPSGRAMEVFLRQLSAGADRQPALTLGRGTLHRFRDALHHVPPMPALAESYPVTAPGSLRLPHGEVLVEADRHGAALRDGLEIRFRRGGERLLTGGHHRSLKHLLQEAGLAPWLRDRLPLLYDAEGLAAVPGIACRDSRGRDHGSRFAVRWLPGDVAFAGAFR